MSKKVKPILVVRTPHYNKNLGETISKGINHEYHVLVVAMPENSEVTFETFNTDNITGLDLKDLKKAVFENNKSASNLKVLTPSDVN